VRADFGDGPVTLTRISGASVTTPAVTRELMLYGVVFSDFAACCTKPPFVSSTTNVLASAIEAVIWSLNDVPALLAVSTRMSALAW
jgi:hypothetical protein